MPPKTVQTPQQVQEERPGINNLTKRQRNKIARKPGRNNDLTKGLEPVKKTVEDLPWSKPEADPMKDIFEFGRHQNS